MILENNYLTLIADQSDTLVKTSHPTAVISIKIYGGDNGGNITFLVKTGTTVNFRYVVSVLARNTIFLDDKTVLAGDQQLDVLSDKSGVLILASYSYSE